MTFPGLPRSAWTSTPNKRGGRPIVRALKGLTLHWPADGSNMADYTQEQVAEKLRTYRNLHVNGNGWIDIGYNFAVDQAGRIWDLTGINQGAHAGTNKGNQTTVGVLLVYGMGESPSQAMIDGVRRLRKWLLTQNGDADEVFGHRDHKSTTCPGQPAYNLIHQGAFGGDPGSPAPPVSSGGGGGSAPGFPLRGGWYFGPKSGPAASVSGYFSHREDLRRWQAQMRARGWAIGVDGLYGTETARVARAFQKEKGLSVDGLIGSATWAAAWNAPIT